MSLFNANEFPHFDVSKQKPSERACGYWIVNSHNGTKKSSRVLVLLQNIYFQF